METEKMRYMRRAIELAYRGMGHTSPNPMVGCVIVRDGKIIAEGWHEAYGGLHAERNALKRCPEELSGAEMFVTLEPCCHYGKTPPCTDAIIERGIRKVVIGSMDPNPLVGGKGAAILREHGIEVETGVLEEDCQKINEVFFHFISRRLPYVIMKYAMTLDGKIACHTGDSKWVTGEEARKHAHWLRKRYSAVLVGIGTVLHDNPMLNCRIENGVDPLRIVCDSHLRIPLESALVKTARDIPTAVFAVDDSNKEKIKKLEEAGVALHWQAGRDKVDLDEMLKTLGEKGIDSVLVEGGGTLHASFLQENLVHKLYAYIAPKLIGGEAAKGPVMGRGIAKMCDAIPVRHIKLTQLGEDILVRGYLDE